MKKIQTVAFLLFVCTIGFAMGRKDGDGYDIQPVKKGSAANPNSAYNAPGWEYTPPPRREDGRAERKMKRASKKTAEFSPETPELAPAAEPEAGKLSSETVPLSKDSLEPPLPDEPGGDPDQRPSK